MKNVIVIFFRRMQAVWVCQPTTGSHGGTSVLLRAPIDSVDWLRSWPAHVSAPTTDSASPGGFQNDLENAPTEKSKAEVYCPATYHLTNW